MIEVDVVGQLLPNWFTMIVQLCCTFVLFLIAKKFVYKPVMDMLDKRAQASYDDLASAKLANENASASLNKANAYLTESKAKANQIVQEATSDANKVSQEIIQKANVQASNVLNNANQAIEAKENALLNSVSDQMVDIALSASEKLLQQKANKESDQNAVEQFVKDMVNHG